MFIDFTVVNLFAGNGGKGAVSFRREKFIPLGGPDGGDGGRGGHIIFKADSNLRTLQDVRYSRKYHAENGLGGGGSRKTGRSGKDKIIRVPVGTLIKNAESQDIIGDLTSDTETVIACMGGRGGKGNIRFKSATNRAPRKSQPGEKGEQGSFEIELKILADVGLIGMPNAGKSTLLSHISAAKPKIADYPFTTLEPNLGIVKYGEYKSFVMADIPGLIKGASKGKGLGHKFLKHVERNKVLLYLIESIDPHPFITFKMLEKEILDFNSDLVAKPAVICRTKSDINIDLSKEWNDFNQDVRIISSVSGEGLSKLIDTLCDIIN